MGKINSYPNNTLPALQDKLIGTRVGKNPANATYNFTISDLLSLIAPLIPADDLQAVLNKGNQAIQDIFLDGKISSVDVEISDKLIVLGRLMDNNNLSGTSGQILSSTGTSVEWTTPSSGLSIPTLSITPAIPSYGVLTFYTPDIYSFNGSTVNSNKYGVNLKEFFNSTNYFYQQNLITQFTTNANIVNNLSIDLIFAPSFTVVSFPTIEIIMPISENVGSSFNVESNFVTTVTMSILKVAYDITLVGTSINEINLPLLQIVVDRIFIDSIVNGTDISFPELLSVDQFQIGNFQSDNVSAPKLLYSGNIDINVTAGANPQTLDLSLLEICGGLNIVMPNLTALNFTALTIITQGGNLTLQDFANNIDVDFPLLTSIGSEFVLQNFETDNILFPSLTTVSSNVNINVTAGANPQTLDLSLLQICDGDCTLTIPKLTNLSLPALTTINGVLTLSGFLENETISFPVLSSLPNDLTIENSQTDSISFPSLTTVGSNVTIDVTAGANPQTLDLSFLDNINGSLGVTMPNLTEVIAPSLTTIGGSLNLSGFLNNVDINFPLLQSFSGGLDLRTFETDNILFPSLTSAAGVTLYVTAGANPQTLDLSSLVTCSGVFDNRMPNLSELNLPALTSVGDYFIFYTSSLDVNVNVPVLETISSYLSLRNFQSDSILFPSLTSVAGIDIIVGAGVNPQTLNLDSLQYLTATTLIDMPNLNSFSLPSLIEFNNGSDIEFKTSLAEASVDGILVKFAALDGTGGTTLWNSGSLNIAFGNAAPSAIGLAAKATLEGRGIIVTVN